MSEISGDMISNEELALRARKGDREARNQLFLRLRPLINSKIYPAKRLLGRLPAGSGPLESEDVDQEAFLLFCELLDDWQPERSPFTDYLSQMILWRAYRYVRSSLHFRSTRIKLASPGRREMEEIGETVSDPAEPYMLVEGTEEWNRLLAQVKTDWRRFVSMKFYEELSSREIASASHCSSRTVNRAIKMALLLLKQTIEEEWEAL